MQQQISAFYSLIEHDVRVKCVVLMGAGDKAFCAGADLEIGFLGGASKTGAATAQNAKKERDVDHRDGGGKASLAIYHSSKPTIAAINGAAVGVGITMTLPCAIRVVYKKAKVGFVFSQRGLIMEAVSSFFLPRLIGTSRAIHLTTTGSVYEASNPLFGHLFSETCDTPDATVQRALEIADQVAKQTSTISTKLMRDLMYRGPTTAEETHLLGKSHSLDIFQ
jgi:enoyl-CoA hydratase/carnithine racemase